MLVWAAITELPVAKFSGGSKGKTKRTRRRGRKKGKWRWMGRRIKGVDGGGGGGRCERVEVSVWRVLLKVR